MAESAAGPAFQLGRPQYDQVSGLYSLVYHMFFFLKKKKKLSGGKQPRPPPCCRFRLDADTLQRKLFSCLF